ncbi:MAG TPA: signal peptidase I [Acidimicrobiales bacterium]|nr:signal peptidase I [Acidimicrobiales bacterium]
MGESEATAAGEQRWSIGSALREVAFLVGMAVVIAVVVKTFVAQAFYIPSGSMLPQLQINDRVVVSKISYRLHDPRRGDILVFDAPGDGEEDDADPLPERALRGLAESIGVVAPSTDEYIKRVVALPGERVEGHHGKVLVDGLELVEPYLPAGTVTSDFPAVVVPPQTVFVLGDNRANSADSRTFGPIPRSTVVGRAILRVWPLAHASFL